MTHDCGCERTHERRRVVLTGGPGAGKTAVLELVRRSLCRHVQVLPEAAGILFGGGFPRHGSIETRRAAQRAIYHVQRELEAVADADSAAIALCDRGTIDGAAYWPGPESFWDALVITRETLMARYDAVIHLRVPNEHNGYGHQNPLRVESVTEALAIDERILDAWAGHPRRYIIDAESDFMRKAEAALAILEHELPECCRPRLRPATTRSRSEPAEAVRPTRRRGTPAR